MPKVQNTIHLEAAPDRVWSIVGDIKAAGVWIPGIARVEVDGDRRICTFADGSVQHERISDYDSRSRSYGYAIEVGPLPLKTNRGRFHLHPERQGTSVHWDAELEALDPAQEPALVQMLDGAYKQVLSGLKRLVETPAATGASD